MALWDTGLPLSPSAGSLNKVTILCHNSSPLLLGYCAASSTGLDSITVGFGFCFVLTPDPVGKEGEGFSELLQRLNQRKKNANTNGHLTSRAFPEVSTVDWTKRISNRKGPEPDTKLGSLTCQMAQWRGLREGPFFCKHRSVFCKHTFLGHPASCPSELLTQDIPLINTQGMW